MRALISFHNSGITPLLFNDFCLVFIYLHNFALWRAVSLSSPYDGAAPPTKLFYFLF